MSDFNKKLSTLAAKAELKAEQDDLIQVIFIGIFFFLVVMVFKSCLCINQQHLIH